MHKSMMILGGALAATLSVATLAGDHDIKPAAAWTPASLSQALQVMPKGDIARGKQLHSDMFCASCHGEHGESMTMNWPSLAGQRAEYTYKMLQDYKARRRIEDERAELMAHVSQNLSVQDMADLSVFYAAQTLPKASLQADEATLKLVRKGDPARLVTPCASCHGLHGQGGINETPALAGMSPDYFERTMKLYRDGKRHSDTAEAMRAFARPLTDGEITALAQYYAALSPK